MPTYRNTTTSVIVEGPLRVEPGQSVTSTTFLKTLPTGLVQDAATPVFSNVLYAEKITGSKTVTLDSAILQNYKVRVFVSTGDVTVKLNDASSTGVIIGAGDAFEVQCMTRTVDNLIFTISTGTAFLLVTSI